VQKTSVSKLSAFVCTLFFGSTR